MFDAKVLKILIITSLFPPLGSSGHDERCRQVVYELASKGHHVQVLTSNYRVPPSGMTGEEAIYRRLELDTDSEESKQMSFGLLLGREEHNARMVHRRVKRFKPDVLLVWNMTGLQRSIGLVCQSTKLPVVYDLHTPWLRPECEGEDAWSYWWNERSGFRLSLKKFILTLFGKKREYMRWLPVGSWEDYDLSHSYLCSQSLKAQLLDAGVRAVDNLPVLYPSLNTEKLVPKRTYATRGKFIWAGRITVVKGPTIALEAVKLLLEKGITVEVDFFVIGEPIERKQLRERINEMGLDAQVNVTILGSGEIYERYPNYDALLFTSYGNDPMPITPIEAMASGLPVILSSDGGIQEITEAGKTALAFEAGSVESLADAIQRFMRLEDGGEEMAKNALEGLHREHSFTEYVSKIESYLMV